MIHNSKWIKSVLPNVYLKTWQGQNVRCLNILVLNNALSLEFLKIVVYGMGGPATCMCDFCYKICDTNMTESQSFLNSFSFV